MLHRVDSEFTPPELLDGRDWSGELALTEVWVRRNGRWQLVRRHASTLAAGVSNHTT